MLFETEAEAMNQLHDDIGDGGLAYRRARPIKEVIQEMPLTNYQGSEITKAMVEEQIKERWGEEVAKQYDPFHNVRSYRAWTELGRCVKKNEHALKSMTIVEKKDKQGKILKTYRRPVFLFHILQTEEVAKS